MAIKVIPIKVKGLKDLVRLVANVRRERSILLSIEYGGDKYLGFYLPPQIKGVQGVFVYADVKESFKYVSYSPNDGGVEKIVFEYVDSPTYINIPVVSLSEHPHNFVSINDFDVDATVVSLKDMESIIHIAYSTTLENVLVPFVWYISDRREYVLNVDAPSDDDKDYIIFFKYAGDLPESPFIEFDPLTGEINFVDVARDVRKKYLLVVDVVEFMV